MKVYMITLMMEKVFHTSFTTFRDSWIFQGVTTPKECFLETQRVTYPAQSHANLYQCNAICILWLKERAKEENCFWFQLKIRDVYILTIETASKDFNISKNFDCLEKMTSGTDWNSLVLFFLFAREYSFLQYDMVNIRHLCEGTFSDFTFVFQSYRDGARFENLVGRVLMWGA